MIFKSEFKYNRQSCSQKPARQRITSGRPRLFNIFAIQTLFLMHLNSFIFRHNMIIHFSILKFTFKILLIRPAMDSSRNNFWRWWLKKNLPIKKYFFMILVISGFPLAPFLIVASIFLRSEEEFVRATEKSALNVIWDFAKICFEGFLYSVEETWRKCWKETWECACVFECVCVKVRVCECVCVFTCENEREEKGEGKIHRYIWKRGE